MNSSQGLAEMRGEVETGEPLYTDAQIAHQLRTAIKDLNVLLKLAAVHGIDARLDHNVISVINNCNRHSVSIELSKVL